MGKLSFYAAGGGAGALTSFLDLLKDPNQGTIARMGPPLKQALFGNSDVFFGAPFWAIILVILSSLFVCWVFEVTSRLDGFLRGCTILAAFSIGAPSPIINKQISELESGSVSVTRLSELPLAISKANAQASINPGQSNTSVGEVFVVLGHLKDIIPRPDSTVTIRSASSNSPIAIFRIPDNIARILQPYGKYIVEIQTPGFTNISFDLTIDQSLATYSVSAEASGVPLALQRLLATSRVQLRPNDAEKFKQLGVKRRLVDDFEGAISNYKQAIALEKNDGLTHDYLGYSYFRLGKYEEAAQEFQTAIKLRPDYKWALINLVKVDCAQQKFGEAREKFETIRTESDLWASDAEFVRICASIVK
jgi:hypothetical protein